MNFDKFLCCRCSVKTGGFIIGWFYFIFTILRSSLIVISLVATVKLRESFLKLFHDFQDGNEMIYEVLCRAGFFIETTSVVLKALDGEFYF